MEEAEEAQNRKKQNGQGGNEVETQDTRTNLQFARVDKIKPQARGPCLLSGQIGPPTACTL
jgi:hypothetical protein